MKKRYYDYDTLVGAMHDVILKNGAKHRCIDAGMILDLPKANVVEIVRCKDCKWSNDDCSECMNPNLALGGDYASCLYIDPNWFCADGEQKEEKQKTEWHEIISADDLPNFCRTVLVELRSGDRQVAQLDINPWTRVPGWLIPNGEWLGPIDIVKRWMEITD